MVQHSLTKGVLNQPRLRAVAIFHSVLPISLPLPLWDSEHVIWSQQATSSRDTNTHTHTFIYSCAPSHSLLFSHANTHSTNNSPIHPSFSSLPLPVTFQVLHFLDNSYFTQNLSLFANKLTIFASESFCESDNAMCVRHYDKKHNKNDRDFQKLNFSSCAKVSVYLCHAH